MKEKNAIDQLFDFCNVMQQMNGEIMLELPNYPVFFKWAIKNHEQLKEAIKFYKNPNGEVPNCIWQPYEKIGSNRKLDKYYLTIFEPAFQSITAVIVSDRYGNIWIHETLPGPKYDNRYLSKDIYSFFEEMDLKFKSNASVNKSLNKELKAKVWLDEKYNEPTQMMDFILLAINEAGLEVSSKYLIEDRSIENGKTVCQIKLLIDQIEMDFIFNTEEDTWKIIKEINARLKLNNFGYQFAFLHEYAWDSMYILGLLSEGEYELLLRKNLISVQLLN
ncbi:MAG: hypothetical protein AAF985_05605 [Bacteroidota bacterium]